MSPRVTLFLFFFLMVSPCIAGDSTSLAPGGGSGIEHDVETYGGDVRTSGGNVNVGSGQIEASGVKTKRLYDYGSGSWIKVKDNFDMENNVLYDVRRIRMNDTWPNQDNEVASKRYVDAKAGGSINIHNCHWLKGWENTGVEYCNGNEAMTAIRVWDHGPGESKWKMRCCDISVN